MQSSSQESDQNRNTNLLGENDASELQNSFEKSKSCVGRISTKKVFDNFRSQKQKNEANDKIDLKD